MQFYYAECNLFCIVLENHSMWWKSIENSVNYWQWTLWDVEWRWSCSFHISFHSIFSENWKENVSLILIVEIISIYVIPLYSLHYIYIHFIFSLGILCCHISGRQYFMYIWDVLCFIRILLVVSRTSNIRYSFDDSILSE